MDLKPSRTPASQQQRRPIAVRSLVIYESEYGNTETLARAIARTFGKHGEARVTLVSAISDLGNERTQDLLVIGAPTQRHGLPDTVKELLERVPSGALAGTRALAFDTRYRRSRWITGSAARTIGRLLRGAGCELLAEPESFFVMGSEGPLEPGEEDRARAWVARALSRIDRPEGTKRTESFLRST
jgi:flavodoxin